MSTGDLKNNLRKLQAAVKLVHYQLDVDFEAISKGIATSFLPLYHYVFISYSRPLAEQIAGLGIELYGKTDLRFMESVYKVLRELFSYKPPITKDQFFSNGFAERKIIMCTEILTLAHKRHKSLAPKQTRPKSSISSSISMPANSSKVAQRASCAPTTDKTSKEKSKTHKQQAKAAGEKNSAASGVVNTTQSVPHVVNELRNPTIAKSKSLDGTIKSKPPVHPGEPSGGQMTPAIVKECLGLPRNQRPVTTVQPHFTATGENIPMTVTTRMGDTGCDIVPGRLSESSPAYSRMSATSVEVISMQKEVQEDVIRHTAEGDLHIRPIDVIAKTPAPPRVRGQQLQHEYEKTTQEQLHSIQQTIRELNARVVGMENRMSVMEGLLSIKQKEEEQKAESLITPEQMANLMARLTLIENKVTIVEASKKTQVPIPIHCNGNNAAVELACQQREPPERDISPEEERSTPQQFPERLEPHVHVPSPIHFPAAIKQLEKPTAITNSPSIELPSGQSSETPPDGSAKMCSSTPTEPADGATNAEQKFFAASLVDEQAKRITEMLRNTEDLLNIQVDSPARPAKTTPVS